MRQVGGGRQGQSRDMTADTRQDAEANIDLVLQLRVFYSDAGADMVI